MGIMTDQAEMKRLAGETAADRVEDDMIVGLGTGSTVYYTVLKLGEMVRGGLNITGIPTSKATEKLASEQGIKLGTLAEYTNINLTIDGADEVDPQFNLIKGLTVLENVTMPMHYCGTYKGERSERAMELLELVEVPDVADKYPSQISGGQQQRAAIARALSNDPKLIIGDEPTGNLDTVSAGLVFGLFEELVEGGKTIIMVTHDRELAGNIPRVEEVRNGMLMSPDEIDRRLVAR